MSQKTITLEPLQIASILAMIAHQMEEIDEDLNGGDTTDTTAHLLNMYRDHLCSICDALTED